MKYLLLFRSKDKHRAAQEQEIEVKYERTEGTEIEGLPEKPHNALLPFTEEEKSLIKLTWARVESDAEQVGHITFIKLVASNFHNTLVLR